jgi:RNA polymerase sigma-70 factor (ECF subfamily)
MGMRTNLASVASRVDPVSKCRYSSFDEFFEQEYPTLVRALVPAADSLDAAEEAAQDSMRRVFERWRRIERMDSPIGYAYVTGRNSLRRRFRRGALHQAFRDLGEGQGPGERSAVADPAGVVGARDQLLKALARLSSGERDALLLVAYLGLDVSEAARTLKIKPASVRSRIHRARQTLRPFIEEEKDD